MQENKDLFRKIAWLESQLDQAETELSHLDRLLKICGFPGGIETLKATINELMDDRGTQRSLPPEDLPPPSQTFDFF